MSDSTTVVANRQPYDGVQQMFHWLVASLLLIQFATKLISPGSSSLSEDQLNAWHVAVGPTILLVTLLRLYWRVTHPVPPPPTDLPWPLMLLSRATHWGFYAVLIAMPLAGWASLSGFGGRPTLLGLVTLPAIAPTDKALAERWGAIHGAFGWVLLALIALHLGGVIYHAAIKRDGVLGRMLPGA